MDALRTYTAELKSRGQLTIPKRLRDLMNLEEGQVVSIIPMGDAALVTPKRLELDEARRLIRKVVKASRCSIEDLLDGLEEERENLYGDLYGGKTG
jgi:AbrB family looped-hinge helix DNA binding protein